MRGFKGEGKTDGGDEFIYDLAAADVDILL